MSFSRWIFLLAGIYGVVLVGPLFFLEEKFSNDFPPPINHPEHYYGSVCAIFAFQILYLIVSLDPFRYRATVCAGLIGKISYAAAMFILYSKGRLPGLIAGLASVDLVWTALFIVAMIKAKPLQNKDL